MRQTVILIPALNPDERLLRLVRSLRELGFERIVVINDGSGREYQKIFEEADREGCIVRTHPVNKGKGTALKTGIQTAIERFGAGNSYVTADADGQHLPEDIRKVADALEIHPDRLALGTRDFSGNDVPLKSRWGNRITSAFFRLTGGVSCPDTQTGLRGIPAVLESLALSVEGSRYEYEMNFLADASRMAGLELVPIQAVYENGNKESHFRPVADSIRVYGRFLRFAGASLSGAAVDVGLFWLLFRMLSLPQTSAVLAAAVLARICSGSVNYVLNRIWSFRSRNAVGKEAVRYGILFICQMGASAGTTAFLSALFLPEMAAKVLTDTFLFFLSFNIQKNWVFRKEAAA